ncbi:daptide-type RiPP biosynthesis methyltransferase [Frankia sp. R82]|uniref:daptide-type RiPP biosynthesis methyltransferase n=1 Tax=Frankia sp. R82 TaxID=2950553 RepID=UPI002043CA35|nr:daptide-type RiPP biosynthesis methyltransferase [Frankia sp. R82]MCM3883387.1 class I SAM-dependent methyltransferase [Frankia sp. R82]
MTAATAVPGLAGEILAEFGSRISVHDLYDEVGGPVYHDLAGSDTSEIREMLRVVRAHPGPVLELAAGSGRLTLPLLALGREVTALELKESMLDLLRARLAAAPRGTRERCRPVQGDMSAFALGRRFAVVVLGTASVSLLDEEGRAGLYACVRSHLAPGGRFLLSTVELVGDAADGADLDFEAAGASGTRYRMIEYRPAGAPVRNVTIIPLEKDTSTAEPIVALTTTIRILPVDRLENELADAGMTVVARHVMPANGPRHLDVFLEAAAV